MVNVTDYMVGDLVFNTVTNQYDTISRIDLFGVCTTHCERKNVRVKPIHITEEILKANGFVFDGSFWSFRKNDFNCVIIRFLQNIEEGISEKAYSYFGNHWIVDENYRLDYVHELQHALRLVGLENLAINFKNV